VTLAVALYCPGRRGRDPTACGSAMRYLLELDSVGKRFGGNQVLHAASLWATPSAVTYLVGRGGAGKSTMLRIATGAIAC